VKTLNFKNKLMG